MSDALLVDLDARGVLTLTLSRPERHNAFDDAMIEAISAALRRYRDDPTVRALVLAGAGRSFSAGGDLGWMQRMAAYDYQDNLRDAEALADMLHALSRFPAPSIARVHGAAYGGGVGLVSCCDVAVGTGQARFMLSEVRLGLIPATIGPYVIAAIGERAARRYFTTAEPIDADTAASLGLLTERVADDALDAAVARYVDAWLANGPQAVRAAKQLVTDLAGRPIDAALRRETSERIAAARVSAEGQEGLQAFFDKRAPKWRTGRE